MNKAQRLSELLAEIKKRQGARVSFLDPIFSKQNELILDRSRFQGWKCTRRGAKSTTFAKKCLDRLCNNPGENGLYLALTGESAKAILWDIVESELDQKRIAYKPYKREGFFELGNGSELRFFGVDASYREMKKILGRKLGIVGIDEAGSMTIDMENLCYQMIRPALADLQGDLILLGTCENIPNTFHQKVTDGLEPGWKVHSWTTYENPYMAKQWQMEIEDILKNNPHAANASWFKTHYLNQWCADDDLLIIKIGELNWTTETPRDPHTVIGIDLGYNDDSSFTVCQWGMKDPNLYMLESFKSPGMDLTDVANMTKRLLEQYPGAKLIIDGANKQGVEEMRKRHSLPFEIAEKQDKATFLRMFSDDIKQARVLIHKEKCKAFIDESSKLMWLKDTDKEDPRCANHATDSALYAWRYARNYTYKPEVVEWADKNKQMEQYFLEEARKAREEQEEMGLYNF